MKRCPDCGEEKARTAFSGSGYCRPCHNARTRTSVAKNGGARRYHLRKRYGLEPEDVERMTAEQGGLCALCGEQPAVQVDHDHETGQVRGILCGACNAGLGAFGDDVQVMYKPSHTSARVGPLPYCPDCRSNKLPFEFFRNKSNRSGFSTYCKDHQTERTRRSRDRLHGSTQNYLLKLRYRSDQATLEGILARQGGTCAICRRRPARHVDHDHTTGRVRGLLCFNCNRGLGYFRDSVKNLFHAIEYVDRRGIEEALEQGWRYEGWDLSA